MHELEPYFNWRHLYTAEEDPRSPFYGREYSEFECTNTIYNYYLHPQWDEFGSQTLYLKLLFCDYEEKYAIIELIGEWNDLLYNDIMILKRDFMELLMSEGIQYFILIGENVLNFHGDDDSYYEEWFEELDEGWIAMLDFRPHVQAEMKRARVDWYCVWGGELDDLPWRTFSPSQLYLKVAGILNRRLN